MSDEVWDVLGIAPTADEAAIRRAYAARLKRRRPDEDADAFVRLRAAYEAALRRAATASTPVVVDAAVPRPAQPAAVVAAEPHVEPAPPGSLSLTLTALAISRGDVQDAATRLLAVHGDLAMPIGPWMRMTELLADRLATDLALDETIVEAIARQFGWYGDVSGDMSPATKAVRGRIEAAHWLAGVRASAARPSRFFGNEHAAACALLLGRGRLTWSWLLPPYIQLLTLLVALKVHHGWVEQFLDAARLAQLRNLALDVRGRRGRRYLGMFAVLVALAGIGFGFNVATQIVLAVVAPVVLWRMPLGLLRRGIVLALLFAVVLLLVDWALPVWRNGFAMVGFGAIIFFYVALGVVAATKIKGFALARFFRRLRLWLGAIMVGAAVYVVVIGMTHDQLTARIATFVAYFACLNLFGRFSRIQRMFSRGALHTEVIQRPR